MNIFKRIEKELHLIVEALKAEGKLPETVVSNKIEATPPRDPAHGDIATNAAMVIAAQVGKKPKEIAEILVKRLLDDGLRMADGKKNASSVIRHLSSAQVAGPGFINMTLAPSVWQEAVLDILKAGRDYGNSQMGKGEKVNVEYVSANPTGPMHVGHVRGAVIGDALAHLLAKAGYDVTREYYFNDAGVQVDVLARTTHLRYREALAENIGAIPEGLYPGEYLKEVGAALAQRDGGKWLGKPESEWLAPIRDFAVSFIMKMIRGDLDLIGIHHDVFTNERELIENGTLEKSFQILKDKDLIYVGTLPPPKGKEMPDWEPVPLTLFRSTQFGDSTDRPLKKRDGSWTYFMPDIAYHYDKIRRGFSLMINVLGMDHGGYQERMQPVIVAFSDGKAKFKVIFNNMVKVFKNGEPVKLSKRSGNLITLREMVEEVGPGAVRFFMMTRDPKSPLDFDFAKVVEQSKDNPVFYVQYAHARCRSAIRRAADDGLRMTDDWMEVLSSCVIRHPSSSVLRRLTHPQELALIRLMCNWPRIVEQAAAAFEPHRVAFYLHDLAAAFHAFWHQGNDDLGLRFLVKDDIELTAARIMLAQAVSTVIASGLNVLGVEPLEEMR